MREPRGHRPERLDFYAFDGTSFPPRVRECRQVFYSRRYLAALGAAAVVEEPHYFDRDYLAEFQAFYSTSARGYPNNCRRLHVFRLDVAAIRALIGRGIAGEPDALARLQDSYLGFLVIRPTSATPFGRTVLRWYDENDSAYPRVTEPSREYSVHLAGLALTVRGIAWQQQDNAVGACATVALWTMFHTSARDEHHAIPTTAEITRAANRRWPLAKAQVFPAKDGLTVFQLCEAIRSQALRPLVLEGDVKIPNTTEQAFTLTRFSSSVAALLRSGYPVLVCAKVATQQLATNSIALDGTGHAVCAVGFRTPKRTTVQAGDAVADDAAVEYVYLHDDNLGPGVRFKVLSMTPAGVALLTPSSPNQGPAPASDPTNNYFSLLPCGLVAAIPDEVRVSSDKVNSVAITIARALSQLLKAAGAGVGLTYSSRFYTVREYLSRELGRRLAGRRLAKCRMALTTRVRPMSLHIAVIRLAIDGVPVVDFLLDTSDSEPAQLIFAHIVYDEIATTNIALLNRVGIEPGVPVYAY